MMITEATSKTSGLQKSVKNKTSKAERMLGVGGGHFTDANCLFGGSTTFIKALVTVVGHI